MSAQPRRFQAPSLLPDQFRENFQSFRRPERPLDVEIGCGVGFHPLQRARQHPDRQLVAIEHTQERFEKFARRVAHHEPFAQLFPVHANAISWVHEILPAESVDCFFILYPNPNSQNPAQRWMRMPFMGRLLDSLKVGGTLQMATNIESYAQECREWGERVWGLRLQTFREIPSLEGIVPRTHFEKKYLERGEACYDLEFHKIDSKSFYFGAENRS